MVDFPQSKVERCLLFNLARLAGERQAGKNRRMWNLAGFGFRRRFWWEYLVLTLKAIRECFQLGYGDAMKLLASRVETLTGTRTKITKVSVLIQGIQSDIEQIQ